MNRPPVDLYLISEKSIWKKSSWTNWIFSLFWTWFLLTVYPAKIQFQNWFLQAKNPVFRNWFFPTWFFKIQVRDCRIETCTWLVISIFITCWAKVLALINYVICTSFLCSITVWDDIFTPREVNAQKRTIFFISEHKAANQITWTMLN